MVSFAPLNDETLEDKRRYLEGHLVEVACLDCLAKVKVRKQSEFHTSVEWGADAVRHCAEFSKARNSGDFRMLPACRRMQSSIEDAVREGRIAIGGTVD